MLVLTRKIDERIYIGDDIVVMVTCIKPGMHGSPGSVRIGIDAPDHVNVVRAELVDTPPRPRAPKHAVDPGHPTMGRPKGADE